MAIAEQGRSSRLETKDQIGSNGHHGTNRFSSEFGSVTSSSTEIFHSNGKVLPEFNLIEEDIAVFVSSLGEKDERKTDRWEIASQVGVKHHTVGPAFVERSINMINHKLDQNPELARKYNLKKIAFSETQYSPEHLEDNTVS